MAIVIPAIFFSTLLFAFVGTGRYGLRQSAVYAATVYTLCLVLTTELLSIWEILRFGTLIASWVGLAIVSGLYLYFYGDRQAVLHTLNGAWTRFRETRALWAVSLIWSVVLAIAIVYPPNNWDSMMYHMPRVMSWIRQGSIDFFPTANLLQLYQPPLAEWNILHFQILSGSDRFANTVQWLALVGCGIAASLIARELQQPFPVQVLAVVIAATLPMGLLQGSSTQNDLVVSFWLLAFVLFALQYLRKPTVGPLVFCGLALGFALLTKGTAYIFFPALAVMLLLYGVIHAQGTQSRVKVVSAALMILAIALLLNTSHYARNWSLSGNILYTGGDKYGNDEVNIPIIWSNLVRNSALHWGVPSEKINSITLDRVRGILGDLIDIPEATWSANRTLEITFSKHEDYTGNLLHFSVLVVSLLGIVLLRKRLEFSQKTFFLGVSLILGYFLFCGLLKWQIWHTRLHTPLFMLGAPVAVVFLSSLGSRIPRHFTKIFLIMSVPWIFFNEIRPIYSDNGYSIFSVDRIEAYFRPVPELFHPYIDAVDYLKKRRASEIGIDGIVYEYPIRVLAEKSLENMSRLEHVAIGNASRKLRDTNYAPQYTISTSDPLEHIGAVSYRIVWVAPEMIISAREELAHELVGKMFEGDTLVVESKYNVYIRGKALLYAKRPCTQDDVEATFLLEVAPVDVNDLAYHRRQYYSDNLDFRFEEHGWRSGDMCLAARRLPTYEISHITTGQYGSGEDRIWEGSFSLDR